ncbi:hypothetical protein [uncultured Gammaproteobacteria bacterium]|jgi:hypothetical protein|uniref:Porin domain-containing protein n=2 Tax=sulfur-oxidizing symbionts TaxID=32036 RepID=A0A1H6KPH5_9GAMM|nr:MULTISPECIES: hypothetical protein [sulfur-oxidizing symbionts]CAC9483095.1 hypothetical protein [uncultured Gammaproteobacteria bacterium]CAB5508121.1 hypothetical protein AZO1586I_2396 [Bathymodiolus thermophilus thioautotrophic gill symbiont]CAC9508785.1 hypothetical protein [uncultured Gammaproteobacteria bacterium]CAC9512360.1 hypothetical protein [uncultured Gammaproteobacteria bacterium]SEH77646.1 conserved hypothetical protein, secreted [Bathymodiolus azoricus thioautotrophic gill s
MKKLIVAAVATTMASTSMADISIKGDAYIQYADIGTNVSGSNTENRKRVNLNVIGKSGVTTVVVSFRTDDNTPARSGASNLHQFYITTKVGPVNVKAGDFYDTIGLGAWSKSAGKTDALSLSTKVGPVTLGVYTTDVGGGTAAASGATNVSIAAKVAGAKVKLINDPRAKWTDLSASGTFAGISVAAEHFKRKSVNGHPEEKITLLHVGGKAGAIKWDIAQYKNKDVVNTHSNSKFTLLGSMLIGHRARGRTATAVADVEDFSKILGVSVSTKVAGSKIKAIYTKNTYSAADKVTGAELIFTHAVSGGKLTANLAKFSGSEFDIMNGTNKGIRFDIKF